MKKYFLLFFFLLCLSYSSNILAASTVTTGFIPGQIWYSTDSFIEGDTVKIYTALWNNGASSLSAKVEFYDKNVILGSRDIVVPPASLKEVSVSWKVTSGDHSISAKIISPSITTSGKKETVTVSNSTTESDKRFVPVVVNTIDGKPASSSDILKSQVDKATSSLGEIVPESISNKAGESVGVVDNFRADIFTKIAETKASTEKRIEELNKVSTSKPSTTPDTKKTPDKTTSTATKVGIEDATEKPIAYLKLFFLSVLSFVFGSKLIFYSVILVLVFLVLRFIYRKVRNR